MITTTISYLQGFLDDLETEALREVLPLIEVEELTPEQAYVCDLIDADTFFELVCIRGMERGVA